MVALRDGTRVADERPALRLVGGIDPKRRGVRSGLLPEDTDYRDTGCELSESCLRCPLARCKYDEPAPSRRLAVMPRDREIALLRRRYRAPIALLASTYGLSRRSIFRILSQTP